MAGAAEPTVADLYGLPLSVPDLRYLGDRPSNIFNYAVYCAVRLSSLELETLIAALNTPIGGITDNLNDFSLLHPTAVLVNPDTSTIQDIIQQHINWTLDRETRFKNTSEGPFSGPGGLHPSSLIAITDTDWRTQGIMLISLCVNGTGDVFAFPHPAVGAITTLADIEIGNNSFAEAADCIGAPIPITPTELREEAEKEAFLARQPLKWDEENMGRFSLSILYEPAYISPIDRALNGPLAVNTSVGIWPCAPSPWLQCLRLDLITDLEAKIAAVVAGHSVWGSRPGYRGKYNEHLIVIADNKDFDKEGVLVGELDGTGGVIFERVPVGNAFEVLVAKATARLNRQ